MPRFYFHIRGPSGRVKDHTGIEFESLDEAVADATRARQEMLADAALEARSHSTRSFEITDYSGRVLATIPLLDL
jgi:Domain of unknown function (DUF6894)